MFIKKVLMIVLVSVIYVINLNIPVAAEEAELQSEVLVCKIKFLGADLG